MNLETEKVSIVTPAYNSEKWIGETIQSAIAQSYQNWEMLVVVDQGTKDRTAEIVRQFAAQDPRIQLIEIEGKGLSLSRNTALQRARGRYIAFLDADDIWLPQKLEKQLAFMKKNDSVISCTGFRRLSDETGKVGQLIVPPAQQTYRSLLCNNGMALFTVIVDQKKTGPLHMVEHIAEDFILWLSLLRPGAVCHGLIEDLGRYRISPTSRSMRSARLTSRWRILRDFEKLPVPKAAFYFVIYICYALWKRLIF